MSALLFIFVIAFSFSSCTKEDGAIPDAKTLLTSKTWTFNTVTNSDASQATYVQLIKFAYTGQTYTFKADGTYTSVSIGGNDAGTWSLSTDNKTLTIDTEPYKLVVAKSSFTIEAAGGFVLSYK